MRLRPGVRLGPYEIIELLGTGGMGEVYRARDTKLHRDVAVKVLPDFVETGPVSSSNVQSPRPGSNTDRLARFEREARLLASLNHPNIAHVYGLEEAEGVRALVMELVEGETLETRIARGPLGVRDTLAIARQISDALEAAHDQGIVHRDLKPANVKLTADGMVKVLDFGIAKALSPLDPADPADTPTMLTPATDLGVIIGTAAYMAPEQVRGKPVDKRADIWSFGVVLYEMLTGRRPFEGETVSDTLAAVLEREPDWNRLPPDTPVGLRTLVKRTLRKDPKERLRDVADTFIGDVDGPAAVETGAQPMRRPWMWIASTAALLLALPLAALLGWRYARSNVDPGWTGEVLGGTSIAVGPRISPDGAMLAFQAWVDGLNQVAVMKPESGNWTVLTHDRSQGQIMDLSWSPDGTRVYFDRYLDVPRGVFAVPVLGGDARPIVDDAIYPKVLPDGSLLVVKLTADRRFQLHHFWPDKRRTDPLPAFWTPNQGLPLVAAFPDGREAVFYGLPAGAESGAAYSLNVIDLGNGRSRVLDASIEIVQGAFSGGLAVAPDTGHVLVDTSAGNLHRIVSIARDGSRRPLLTLSAQTAYLDAGRDGTIYADQLDRIGEILRVPVSGGVPERMAVVPSALVGEAYPLSLPDGRVLLSSRLSGRMRIMVAGGGRDPSPLLETQMESRTPAAVVNDDEIAFVLDVPPNQTIAIASVTTGRVLRRLEATRGASVASLAVARDRQTIFYASRGTVWAVPITDGPTRRIHQGDSVAVDPRTGELIIQLFDASGARLVRVDPAGSSERAIPFTSDVFMALLPMSGSAVDQQGRILVQVTGRDFWFWQPGVVHPAMGRLDRIPLTYDGDALSPGWSRDGAVVTAGFSLASSIWRFRQHSP